jgi:hypothetical protein
MALPSDAAVSAIVLICVLIGFLVAIYYSFQTAKVLLRPASEPLMSHQQESSGDAQESKVETIATIVDAIAEGAHAFLMREYTYLAVFIVVFSMVVLVAVGTAPDSTWSSAGLAMVPCEQCLCVFVSVFVYCVCLLVGQQGKEWCKMKRKTLHWLVSHPAVAMCLPSSGLITPVSQLPSPDCLHRGCPYIHLGWLHWHEDCRLC